MLKNLSAGIRRSVPTAVALITRNFAQKEHLLGSNHT